MQQPDGAPVVAVGRAGLVGRADQLARLVGLVDRALDGETAVALICGEPGIGKTRLLRETCAAAEGRGARVLRGSGYEGEGVPPYLPFIEALRPVCRAMPAGRLQRLAAANPADLVKWFPELEGRLGRPAPYGASEMEGRLRLFDTVTAVLAGVSRSTPLLVALDDLQWADSASLDFLVYAADKAWPARILFIGAHRDWEDAGSGPLARTIAELVRRRLVHEVLLRRLTADETARLVAGLLGGPPTAALARQIYEQCEGNPFFAEEFVKFLAEEGRLRASAAGWRIEGVESLRLPPSIRATILSRVARLGPDLAAVLRVAALRGRRVDVASVARVAGLDAATVERRLAEAERAGLLAREPGGGVAFAHDTIREALYQDVPASTRRRLHTLIGRALERPGRVGRPAAAADLAYHFGLGEDPRKGLAYALKAAHEAAGAHAYAEAARHYEAALRLMGEVGAEGAGSDEAALNLELGDAHLHAASYTDALASFERARDRYESRHDRVGAGRALRGIGTVHARREDLDRALDAFHAALAAWAGLRHEEAVELRVQLGNTYTVSKARYDEGERWSREAVAMAARLRNRRLQAVASLALGNTLTRRNALGEGRRLLGAALDLALAADDPVTAADASASLAVLAYWTADLAASREATVRREALAKRCGDLYQLRHVYTWLGFLAYSRGEWDEAERWLGEAEPIIARLDTPEPRAFQEKVRGQILYQRGRLEEAERLFGQATSSFRRIDPGILVWYLGWLVVTRLDLGRLEEARAGCTELEGLIERLPAGALASAPALNFLGIATARLGPADRAARGYERLSAFAGQLHYVLTDRVLGMLAATRGDRDAAGRHFREATAAARRHGIRPELALTLLERARADLGPEARPDRERALATLADAFALASELGMARTAAEARRLMEDAGPRGGAAARPASHGLTTRQIEVLRLVAEGRSNRDIAVSLDLSEKTVINHLTAIFNRLDVDNRAAATAFALRSGLI